MNRRSELKEYLEKEIIGCMINDVKSIPGIANKLIKENFSGKYSELFEKIIEKPAVETSEDLVILLMRDKIENISISELLGLKEKYITYLQIEAKKILQNFLDICFVEQTEKILKTYLRRAKEEIAGFDLIEELRAELGEKVQQVQKFFEEKPFSLNEVIKDVENELTNGNKDSIMLKNIPSMNYAAGGFKPSNLVGIAGSFKSGKTTLALNVILDLVRQNIPCGFFSLELSEVELKRKIAGMLTGVSYENLREPRKLTIQDKEALVKAFGKDIVIPLHVSDNLSSDIEIYNKSKYWKNRFNVKAVCIDYLGYIKAKKKFDKREGEVAYYSAFLKQLAKELNILVIAIAQLNRAGKLNPNVDNLAESIGLARDCDFLFITYSPLEAGIKSLNGTVLNESHFICRMEVTRHSKNGKKEFLLKMKDDGTFIEVATEYNTKIITEKIPDSYKSFIDNYSGSEIDDLESIFKN